MLKRIATAVVLIPIVMLLVLRAPVPVLAVVAAAVALITVQEFLKLTEGYGVQPDIRIENSPEDNLSGKDRQLEAAVSELLKEIGQ